MKNYGILLHLTSTYNELGVGDLGKSAYEFVDFLAENGYSFWSMLPVTEVNKFNCPYGPKSSYGFETTLLDLYPFVEKGYITEKEYFSLKVKPYKNRVNLDKYRKKKLRLCNIIFEKISKKELLEIERQLKKDAKLYNYALYKSLCEYFKTNDWRNFDEDIKLRESNAIEKYTNLLYKSILKYAFLQITFRNQFIKLKKYANNRNVELWGDIPIYLETDSFDVWENPNLWLLDDKFEPTFLGGVPEDGINPIQNWNTCIYDWKGNKANVFKWWKTRINNQLIYFDKVRLDHFIGLINCYKIYPENKKNGYWDHSGGKEFFDYLLKTIPKEKIIVEDLGTLSKECIKVRNDLTLLGMCVLQNELKNGKKLNYKNHKVKKNIVYYTGTHDNNTTLGFVKQLSKSNKQKLKLYFDCNQKITDEELAIKVINLLLNSKADYKLLQMQDILLEPSGCRMNIPSKKRGNWNYVLNKNYKLIYEKNLKFFEIMYNK